MKKIAILFLITITAIGCQKDDDPDCNDKGNLITFNQSDYDQIICIDGDSIGLVVPSEYKSFKVQIGLRVVEAKRKGSQVHVQRREYVFYECADVYWEIGNR